jgi:hypothetical protein
VSLAVVFKKTVAIFRRTFVECVNVGAVGEKNIQLAVVVVIEHGHTSGHGFRSMTFGSLVGVKFEIDWLVGELDRAISRRFS